MSKINHGDSRTLTKNILSEENLLRDIERTITEGRKSSKKAMRAILTTSIAFATYIGYFLSFIGDHHPTSYQYRISFYLTGLIGFMNLVFFTMVLLGGPFSKAILRAIPRWMEKKSVRRSALVTAFTCGFLGLMLLSSQLTDLMTIPVYAYAVITAGVCTGLYMRMRAGKDKGLSAAIMKEFEKEQRGRVWLRPQSRRLNSKLDFLSPQWFESLRTHAVFKQESETVQIRVLGFLRKASMLELHHT